MRDILHSARPALLSRDRWKSRLLLWTAACAVAGAAIAFAWLADAAQALLKAMLIRWPLCPWLLAPGGFALIAWVTRRYFSGAEGSGIPQTIAALNSAVADSQLEILRLRIVIGRMVLAAAALVCGASIGREGPTVHVGAAIGRAFARWMPHADMPAQRRALVLAGGAAGVAAAFNTPLAGVVFAIEELARSFEERASGVTLTAVMLAGVIVIAIKGDYAYFGHPRISSIEIISLAYIALAPAAGIAGGIFSRLVLAAARGLPGLLGRLQKRHAALFALGCGLAVASIGWISGGLTFGTGYDEARSILETNSQMPWWYAPERALATVISYLSGVPAGLFAPSLSVGAALGQFFADFLDQAARADFAVLGMCGYLAGVTQAPLTSFVIVMEMTSGHQILVPLMITAAVAAAISKLFSPPLYRALAERYMPPVTR